MSDRYVQEWVHKAEEDYTVAVILAVNENSLPLALSISTASNAPRNISRRSWFKMGLSFAESTIY